MDIFDANADLWRNFAIAISATTQSADVLQKVDRSMLSPGAVLNEAHDQAITFFGLNYNGRDFRLTELDERFDSTLAANKIIACRVRVAFSRADRNRTLESDIGRCSAQFPESCGDFGLADLESESGQWE